MIVNLLLVVIISSCFVLSSQGQLQAGFYANSCPDVEAIVGGVVRDAAASDDTIAPALLRLHFHDCIVEGCDGWILIDNGVETDEKHAFGHQGVRGFDVIERAKSQVEAVCPGIVSCADILAMTARDAVSMAKGPLYEVELGRRDGMVSDVKFAANMPDVTDSILNLKAKFLQKGLSDKDLVLLTAAHTIGTTACFFMNKRLYTFPANGGTDPSINPALLPELRSTCPKGSR